MAVGSRVGGDGGNGDGGEPAGGCRTEEAVAGYRMALQALRELVVYAREARLLGLKKKLQQAVEWPIKHATAFARLGISPVRGVLLHGPPGCSKTTLAKAAAHASQASFFSLSGAELYSKYVGEGDALLRRIFQRARLSAPSIIFFDEADAIAPKRTGPDGDGNAIVGESLLSTLLTEMDGLELATGIIVLAATNRPKAIDAALLRPGRFDMACAGKQECWH